MRWRVPTTPPPPPSPPLPFQPSLPSSLKHSVKMYVAEKPVSERSPNIVILGVLAFECHSTEARWLVRHSKLFPGFPQLGGP